MRARVLTMGAFCRDFLLKVGSLRFKKVRTGARTHFLAVPQIVFSAPIGAQGHAREELQPHLLLAGRTEVRGGHIAHQAPLIGRPVGLDVAHRPASAKPGMSNLLE